MSKNNKNNNNSQTVENGVITKSPYEAFGRSAAWCHTAEHGEVWFDALKYMLRGKDEDSDDDDSDDNDDEELDEEEEEKQRQERHQDLAKLFGGNSATATALEELYYKIDKSGMCYSPKWIGDDDDDDLEDDVSGTKRRQKQQHLFWILLCLIDSRLAKAQQVVLKSIVVDLNCPWYMARALNITKNNKKSNDCAALFPWNIDDTQNTEKYRNLKVALENPRDQDSLYFCNKRLHCYKCVIFVARAMAICDLFVPKQSEEGPCSVPESLVNKIQACLDIMNEHVRVNPQKLAKWEKKMMASRHAAIPTSGLKSTGLAALNNSKKGATSSSNGQNPKQHQHSEISDTTNGSTTNEVGEKKKKTNNDNKKKISEIYSKRSSSSSSGISTSSSISTGMDKMSHDVSQPHGDVASLSSSMVPLAPGGFLKAHHEHLGQAILQLKDQIMVETPQELRAKWKEELRQELLQEMMMNNTKNTSDDDIDGSCEKKSGRTNKKNKKRRRTA
mmetsp:Transcript_3693/g.6758  ORF Transcript_3693/g.6758 Transcript_3693/m.6758 type:complete len:502 (-) Transcript_3693:713-2218(-)